MKMKSLRRGAVIAAIAAGATAAVFTAPAAYAYDSTSGSRNCSSGYMLLQTVDSGTFAEHRDVNANGIVRGAWGSSSRTTHNSGYPSGLAQWFAHAGETVHSASTNCIYI